METQGGEWKLVSRRRTNTAQNPRITPYKPYNPAFSFASALLSPSNTTAQPYPKQTTTMNPSSPPSSPPPPSQATYYLSPHSPTKLRFPPSAQFSEWRGRCFRCCRTGHTIATCRNPLKCGKCWGEGHSGFRCKSASLNPAAMPYWANNTQQPVAQGGSSFQELLQKPCPLAASSMPANRPKRLEFFSKEDAATLAELTKLERGVVFNTHGLELGFSVEDVAGFAARTDTVQRSELAISILQRDRFLIILPEGLAQETFIKETSLSLWEAGFSFQPWSLMDEGSLVLPEFKVLLDLKGFPPHVYKEEEIARAVGTFGTFLGSVPQPNPSDISCWTVAVAVHRLERVPTELAIHKLGVQSVASVFVRNWLRAPLYTAADLPKHKPKFTKHSLTNDRRKAEAPAPFVVSRRALLEMCKGKDIASLPSEIQEMLASIPNLPPDLFAGPSEPPPQSTVLRDHSDTQLAIVENPEASHLITSPQAVTPLPRVTAAPLPQGIQEPSVVQNTSGRSGKESGQNPKNKRPVTQPGSPQKITLLQRSCSDFLPHAGL